MQIPMTGSYMGLHNTAPLWLLQVGIAVRVYAEGALQLLHCTVAPAAVAAAYPHNHSNLQKYSQRYADIIGYTSPVRGLLMCRPI